MSSLSEGDLIRVDIPDQTDPDHERLHGRCGHIIDVLEDGVTCITGVRVDTTMYRVQFPTGEKLDLQEEAITKARSPPTQIPQ